MTTFANYIRKFNDKSRLKNAFIGAKLTYTRQVRDTKHVILPIIHSVKYKPDFAEFVFTLPNGVDPANVEKHAYVFRQTFGTNTEVSGHLKRFVVRVFDKRIATQCPYMWSNVAKAIDGKRLPIICGMDIRGRLAAYDMAAHPHLLIAGETGSGKSTQLRAIISTLIKSRKPEELRLVLGDLKRSEFHLFRRMAHVDDVCNNVNTLIAQLTRIKTELERRGALLDRLELTHISDIEPAERPPMIVICIDEVALLKRETAIMEIIEEISAIGRALDVFLILSMQRPDAQVLDGKLKNNLTVRMAFRHSDTINSRITIGSGEAADISIKARGRAYLKIEQLTEVQGVYLTDEAARKMLAPYRVERKVEPAEPAQLSQPIFGTLGGDFDE